MQTYISNQTLRNFGFLIGFGFPFLIGWFLPALGGHMFRAWTLWAGIPSLILAILRPNLLLYPYKAWMRLGFILGSVNSYIILGIVYLIILIPISIVLRLFGHDPLRKSMSSQLSYREDCRKRKVDLTRIF